MSPKQLGEILFEKLALPYPKKRKKDDRGYSTSKDILDKIRFIHPIVDKNFRISYVSKTIYQLCSGTIRGSAF